MIKLNFKNEIKKAIEIVKLNSKTIINVAKDKNATNIGILILIISATITTITSLIARKLTLSALSIFSAIIGAIIATLVFIVIAVGIYHLLARLFRGKATFIELFRPITYSTILRWLSVLLLIPVIGRTLSFIIGIWSIVIDIFIIKNVYSLTMKKSIIIVLIPIIILLALSIAFIILSISVLGPDFFKEQILAQW